MMEGMNWFLTAVKEGKHSIVEHALASSDKAVKKVLLESMTVGRFSPARVAIEMNDGEMLDIILHHNNHHHFLNRKALDRKTDFERAVERNPHWFRSKFLGLRSSLENTLYTSMGIRDLDIPDKYRDIWMACNELHPNQLRWIMWRAIKEDHRALTLYLWNMVGNNVDPRVLCDWAIAAAEMTRVDLFQKIFPQMNRSDVPDLFPVLVQTNLDSMLKMFLDSKPDLIPDDLRFLCWHNVEMSTVNMVLKTGIFFGDQDIQLPCYVDVRKWRALLLAGFFLKKESKLLRLGPKEPMKLGLKDLTNPWTIHNGFPFLGSLAAVKFRMHLTSTFSENITALLAKGKLCALPERVQNQIHDPGYTINHIVHMMRDEANP